MISPSNGAANPSRTIGCLTRRIKWRPYRRRRNPSTVCAARTAPWYLEHAGYHRHARPRLRVLLQQSAIFTTLSTPFWPPGRSDATHDRNTSITRLAKFRVQESQGLCRNHPSFKESQGQAAGGLAPAHPERGRSLRKA